MQPASLVWVRVQDAQSALAQQLEARTGEAGQLRAEVARLRMALVDAELDLPPPAMHATASRLLCVYTTHAGHTHHMHALWHAPGFSTDRGQQRGTGSLSWEQERGQAGAGRWSLLGRAAKLATQRGLTPGAVRWKRRCSFCRWGLFMQPVDSSCIIYFQPTHTRVLKKAGEVRDIKQLTGASFAGVPGGGQHGPRRGAAYGAERAGAPAQHRACCHTGPRCCCPGRKACQGGAPAGRFSWPVPPSNPRKCHAHVRNFTSAIWGVTRGM